METTNDPNACGERFFHCHCTLPAGHAGPHECVPDPVCGGSWLRHPDDERGMVRVYRYPGNRPGCEMYDSTRDVDASDPPDGEHVLEWDGIMRAPRGGIRYITGEFSNKAASDAASAEAP
jgi:hypothetical protein